MLFCGACTTSHPLIGIELVGTNLIGHEKSVQDSIALKVHLREHSPSRLITSVLSGSPIDILTQIIKPPSSDRGVHQKLN